MNAEDMVLLGVKDGDTIKITSEYGDVAVHALTTKEPAPIGMIFVPMGPWANLVVIPDTESTSMPSYKGPLAVEVEKCDEEVLLMADLMRKAYIK
jgi:formylmethanofuran dehydrogenase subunit D